MKTFQQRCDLLLAVSLPPGIPRQSPLGRLSGKPADQCNRCWASRHSRPYLSSEQIMFLKIVQLIISSNLRPQKYHQTSEWCVLLRSSKHFQLLQIPINSTGCQGRVGAFWAVSKLCKPWISLDPCGGVPCMWEPDSTWEVELRLASTTQSFHAM